MEGEGEGSDKWRDIRWKERGDEQREAMNKERRGAMNEQKRNGERIRVVNGESRWKL